jgi:hypothetical protein
VDARAERIVYGFVLSGGVTARIDDVELSDAGEASDGNEAAKPLVGPERDNLEAFARLYGYVRYFHPSDEAATADWDAIALEGVSRLEEVRGSAALRRELLQTFGAVAPTLRIEEWPGADVQAIGGHGRELAWRHTGLGSPLEHGVYLSERTDPLPRQPDHVRVRLTRDLVAIVPLKVAVGPSGSTLPAALADERRRVKPPGFVPTGDDRASRLAAVIQVWNVLQHFDPLLPRNWRDELPRYLAQAAIAPDAGAFDIMLDRLIASLNDGHARVYRNEPTGVVPFAWSIVEGKFVVTNTPPGSPLRVGDTVEQVNGVAIQTIFDRTRALVSASTRGYRDQRALEEMGRGEYGAPLYLQIRRAEDRLAISVQFGAPPVLPTRHQVIDVFPNGVYYVDLTRLSREALQSRMRELANAPGIIFDLRGYPTPAWTDLFGHLSKETLQYPPIQIPTFLEPDQRNVSIEVRPQSIAPQQPYFSGVLAFVIDPRAISQAETALAIPEHYRLGLIAGRTTAGTNGDVEGFRALTDHRVVWTGLRVLGYDGRMFNGVGIRPTIAVAQTLAGARDGHDDALEAALRAVSLNIASHARH